MDDPKILIALNTILDTLGKMNTAPAVGDDSVTKNIVKSKGSTFDKQNSNEVDADQVRLSTEIAYKYLQKQEKPKSANLGRDRPRLTAEYTLFTKTFYKVMQQLKPDQKGETKVLDPAAKAALAGQEEMNRLLKQLASGKFGKGGPGGGPGGEEGGLFDGLFDMIKDMLGPLLGGLGIGGGALATRLLGRKGRKEAKKQKKAQKKADRDKKKAQKKQDADKKKQQKKQDADKKKQPKKPKPDAKQPKPKTPKPDAKAPKGKTPKPPDVTKNVVKQAGKKGVVKTIGTTAARVGGRFVPGVGWVLLAADVGMMAKGVYDVNKAWKEADQAAAKTSEMHASMIDKIKADAIAKAEGGDPLGALVGEIRLKQQALVKQYNDKQHEYRTNGGFAGFFKGINDEEQAELDRLQRELQPVNKELEQAGMAYKASLAARGDKGAQEYMRRNAKDFEKQKAAAAKRGAAIMKMIDSGMSEDEVYKTLGETKAQKKLREAAKLDAIINDPRTSRVDPSQDTSVRTGFGGKMAEDFMFRNGKFIRFDSKDDILGAKSGGALDKLISRSIPASVGAGAQPVKISNIDSITSEIKTSNAYLQALVKLTAKLAGGGSGGARAMPVPSSSGNDSIPKAQGSPDGPSMVDSRVEFYNSAYSMHTPGTLT